MTWGQEGNQGSSGLSLRYCPQSYSGPIKTLARTRMTSSARLLPAEVQLSSALALKHISFLTASFVTLICQLFAPQVPKQPSWHVLPSFFCRKPYGSVQLHLSWQFVITMAGYSVLGIWVFSSFQTVVGTCVTVVIIHLTCIQGIGPGICFARLCWFVVECKEVSLLRS